MTGPPPGVAAPSPRPRVPGWLRRALALAAAAVICGLVLRGVDREQLLGALAHADLRLVGLAVLLNVTLNAWARALRWKVLLQPIPRTGPAPGTVELAMLLFASQTVSTLLPARAGDALRVIEPHRRHGYSLGGLLAVHLVEKLIEVAVFALLAVPAALTVAASAPPAVRGALWGFVAVAAAGVVLAWRVAGTSPRAGGVRATLVRLAGRLSPSFSRRLESFLTHLGEAIGLLRARPVWTRALGYSLLNDLVDACMIGACLAAVGLHLPPGAWLLVLIAVNGAIAFPSTPGQVGVLEAGAVAALASLQVDPGAALAAALLYHASHLVPVTLLGLVELLRVGAGARAAARGQAT